MKTLFFLLSALLLPFIVFAQKLDKPRIDKITNDTTFFTTTEKVAGGNGAFSLSNEDIQVYVSKSKGDIGLHVIVGLNVSNYKRFHASRGNVVIVKLVDNSIINLTNIDDVTAERKGGGTLATGRMCWTGELSTHVDKVDINKILSSVVTVIRVQTDEGNLDFDIKSKGSDIIKKSFTLILTAKK
jgi:hypothetical protein